MEALKIHLNPKTPKQITMAVKTLVSYLGIKNASPQYLKYTHRNWDYSVRNCFKNCEKESEKTGEQIVYGWLIWEDRKHAFLEAEFHSVLRDSGVLRANSRLIDISPRQSIKTEKVLFIEDTQRVAGRKDSKTWHSWSNLKMVSGHVLAPTQHLEIVEVNEHKHKIHLV
ncbi:MAG: hypothetical protein ACK5NC_04755 [Vibrio sp.]